MFWTVATQVSIMFILMGVGYLAYKVNLISQSGADQMSSVLLYIVVPCVIIDAYQVEPDASLVTGLVTAFVIALGIHVFSVFFASVLIKKGSGNAYKSERFAVIFSNCGFMGFPLAGAVMGEKGILYASAMVAVFNLIQWTYGRALMEGKSDWRASLKSLINPSIIAVLLGMGMFFTKLRFPSVIGQGISYLGGMNTPLAMLIVGTFIARSEFFKSLAQKRIYFVCFLTLIAVPLLCLAALYFLPIDKEAVLACILLAACPSAANTAIFAHKYSGDGLYATNLVVFATLLSAVTIPLMMLLMTVVGMA